MALIMGVDTSSSKSGIVTIDTKTNKIVKLDLWKKDKKKDHYENLLDWHEYIEEQMDGVDLVVIEKVSKSRNLNTVRLLAYFEAAVLLAAQRKGIQILHISPMTARKRAFGNGKLNKESVYMMAHKKFSKDDILPFDKGGNDQTDAICLSLAGAKEF